ncbi:hypothetical protein GCM10011511_53530 [Puia dinghuensis]|uniref:T9SS C-terminal target domain-containing protein n=1 Tax=Puia dinghuensis TaxID=1792502 RepID=A0A8J2UIL7_9BACT|nr:hypothetical protein GCM10011511_53530 [Puia dinghuensis]
MTAGGSAATSSALLSAYTGYTDYLRLTNFGFSIPAGSTILGIQAGVTKESSNLSLTLAGVTLDGSVTDNIVQLVGPGVTSVNRAAGGLAWPTSYATATYGSAADLWGGTTWSTVIVNSASFGVEVSANINGGVLFGTDLVPGASIDLVTLNITYSLPAVLPVRLEQWSVVRQGGANQLTWETAEGGLPGEFVVERSHNGKDWSDLAAVLAGSGVPAGSGAAISGSGASISVSGRWIYNYTDEKPFASGPTYYRLRLHSDGQADTWSVVQVLSAKSIVRPVVTVYPNPFYNTISVSAAETFTHLILTSEQGVALWAKEYPGGITNTQIPVSGLPQGLYYLTIDGVTFKLLKN